MADRPRISIITPSYRNSEWLKLCIASVADQAVELEHIVQDAGSDDGTLDWLLSDRRVKAFAEKDAGMYDAINRGLQRASGEILAWLNCDEQYLPGALPVVAEFFERHPQIEVLFADIVVVNESGEYQFHRKVQTPLLLHTWTCHLSTLSCGTFFRREIIFERKLRLDGQWQAGGDGEWMVRLLRQGVRMGVLRQFTSAFTRTGSNLGNGVIAAREAKELAARAPGWARGLKPAIIAHHRMRRLLGGMYSQAPFSYEIFTRQSPEHRRQFSVSDPRARPLRNGRSL